MESLKKAEQRLAELDQTVAQLKAQNTQFIDDVAKAKTQVVTKTNELYKVEGQKAELEQLVRDLNSQVANKTRVMKALGIRDDQLVADIEPKVDGVVTGVRENVIVISLGAMTEFAKTTSSIFSERINMWAKPKWFVRVTIPRPPEFYLSFKPPQ